MPGIKSLRRIQLFKEVTAGTKGPPTTMWRGTGTMKDDFPYVFPAEDVGVVMPTDRAYLPSKGGTLTLDDTPATFEQLPYLLAGGIKKVVTGVADGGGTGKVYVYSFPTTAKNTIQTYGVEAGDDERVTFAQYGYVESIKLSGKVNEAVMMGGVMKTRSSEPVTYTAATISMSSSAGTISDSAGGFGVFPTTTFQVKVGGSTSNDGYWPVATGTTLAMTLTTPGALVTSSSGAGVTLEQWFTNVAIPAVEEVLFQKGTVYIDTSTGTLGATVKSNSLLSFALDLKTGWKGQPAADGRLDFSFTKSTQPTGTLKMTFEFEGTATTEKAAWLADAVRQLRLQFLGSALGTAGAYTYKTLRIDLVGKWADFAAFADDNGNDTVEGTFQFGYDPTLATAGNITVVNLLTALT